MVNVWGSPDVIIGRGDFSLNPARWKQPKNRLRKKRLKNKTAQFDD